MISRSTKFTFGNSWARIAALCFFLLLVPALWNLAVVKWDHFRNPVPGAFYEVDGAQMHIDCTGSGSPMSSIRSRSAKLRIEVPLQRVLEG
jgi:hypothetical protein